MKMQTVRVVFQIPADAGLSDDDILAKAHQFVSNLLYDAPTYIRPHTINSCVDGTVAEVIANIVPTSSND